MKVNPGKKLAKENFPDDTPEWFIEKFLPTYNDMVEANNQFFTRIDLENNFQGEVKEIRVKSDVEFILGHDLKNKPRRVLVDFASDGAMVLGMGYILPDVKTVRMKIKLDKPEAVCRILIQL